jgi:hypothetical protein
MVHAAGCRMTNSEAPVAQAGDGPSAPLRVLVPMRARRASAPPDRPTCRPRPADDAGLARRDALSEAARALSLGDGVPFTGREYQLLELLWRTEP